MDLSMPVLDGVEATRRIVAARPETHVVVLTSFSDQRRVGEALAAGAVGYLLKDCDPRDLVAAVRSAAAGARPARPAGRPGAAADARPRRRRTASARASGRCCG